MLTGSLGLGDSFPCHLHGNLHAIRSGEYALLPPTIVQCKNRKVPSKMSCIAEQMQFNEKGSAACLSSQALLA